MPCLAEYRACVAGNSCLAEAKLNSDPKLNRGLHPRGEDRPMADCRLSQVAGKGYAIRRASEVGGEEFVTTASWAYAERCEEVPASWELPALVERPSASRQVESTLEPAGVLTASGPP